MGLGYIMIRSPYTPYSIYLRGTIECSGEAKDALVALQAHKEYWYVLLSHLPAARSRGKAVLEEYNPYIYPIYTL